MFVWKHGVSCKLDRGYAQERTSLVISCQKGSLEGELRREGGSGQWTSVFCLPRMEKGSSKSDTYSQIKGTAGERSSVEDQISKNITKSLMKESALNKRQTQRGV